ncbi:MAG: hypothetical protein WA702_27805 [Bradyrhizobium sp.]|uniref:hypothetical protein n=1 Tax=Bradyrhizobium sp. TaxID=376 RepID=UPI003C7B5E4D
MAKSRIPKVRLQPRVTAPGGPSAPPTTVAVPNHPLRRDAATTPLRPSEPEFWTVINEVADPTPIAPAELDAIERYFSAVLDDVFSPSRKASP